jgi:hypothetical protein
MKNASLPMKWLRVAGLALALMALAIVAFAAPAGLRAEGVNAVVNGDFENGTTGWTCRYCTASAGAPAASGAAGQFTTTHRTARAHLSQTNITLEPNTTYELSFWGRSANGANVTVILAQQGGALANYGIRNVTFDLTSVGQVFTHTFTTTNFSQPVGDARLRFLAAKGNGLKYSLDNITLTAGDPPPTPDGNEMLIYDWNKPITIKEGGFAMDKTSVYLSQNWVTPVNYADGHVYIRARIYGVQEVQPGMKLGFCFWQGTRENCRGNPVRGEAGAQAEWDFALGSMWKKNGVEVDWSQPRTKMGFSVRDAQNDPVSNKTSNDWGGNDPNLWYPMDLRFQVVLVPAGQSFSGWHNYP